MADGIAPGSPSHSPAIRGVPIWRAGLAGLGVAAGLAAIELLVESRSDGFRRAFGGPMIPAQAMIAFAIAALLGQASRFAEAGRALGEIRDRSAAGRPGLPLLDEPIHPQAMGAEARRWARELQGRRAESRRIAQFVAAVVPLIGLAVTARDVPPGAPWIIAGQPLFLGLGESFFVLLLNLGVARLAEDLAIRWLGPSPGPAVPAGPGAPSPAGVAAPGPAPA